MDGGVTEETLEDASPMSQHLGKLKTFRDIDVMTAISTYA
jgi:hypothetical protein